MELRHLRYFVAVAEELHFLRAAQRLHIEQSPLSRAIKELESNLGVTLLERTTRSTRLTGPGEVFLEEARQVLAAFAQARASAQAAAMGRKGRLRIGFAEGIAQPRLSELLAGYRSGADDVQVTITQASRDEQLKGLLAGSLDAGLSFGPVRRDGITAEVLWSDAVSAILPSRHPLSTKSDIELKELAHHPLVLLAGKAGADRNAQLEAALMGCDLLHRVEYAENQEVLSTLVGAGCGLGLVLSAQAETIQRKDIVARQVRGLASLIKTYLLYRAEENIGPRRRFLEQARGTRSQSPLGA